MQKTVLTVNVLLLAAAVGVTAQAPAKPPAAGQQVHANLNQLMRGTLYPAAQAKDQDKIVADSETLSEACAACHRKWRDRKSAENRCS